MVFNHKIDTHIEIASNVYGDTVNAPFPFANSDVEFFKRPLKDVEDEVAALLATKGNDAQVLSVIVNQVLRRERRRQWRKRIRPLLTIWLWQLTGYTTDPELKRRGM